MINAFKDELTRNREHLTNRCFAAENLLEQAVKFLDPQGQVGEVQLQVMALVNRSRQHLR